MSARTVSLGERRSVIAVRRPLFPGVAGSIWLDMHCPGGVSPPIVSCGASGSAPSLTQGPFARSPPGIRFVSLYLLLPRKQAWDKALLGPRRSAGCAPWRPISVTLLSPELIFAATVADAL
ncbi:hypothetical protein AAFF_G00306080 [Aldrovandia affinis]|uniref:Uncharacterized protein n=1 Tax=Aldrovandia affinis TaxID=143900 RepID=A0AAD7WRA6_9TELE|nr:hypothetical protein AAFF_G00306080 [Aldrovandia affinis]